MRALGRGSMQQLDHATEPIAAYRISSPALRRQPLPSRSTGVGCVAGSILREVPTIAHPHRASQKPGQKMSLRSLRFRS